MVVYRCKRCGWHTAIRTHYVNHLNRKNHCKAILSNTTVASLKSNLLNLDSRSIPKKQDHSCIFCKKDFSKNSHMHRHIKTCKSKLLVDKDVIILNQKKQIDEMRSQYVLNIADILIKSGTTSTTHTTNIKNQNNINIHINSYGNENLDYITGTYLEKLLNIPFGAIPRLLKDIHFNPNHPENHNIKITNKKLPYMCVFKNNRWVYQDKKEAIDDIVDKGYNILEDHYHQSKLHLEDKVMGKFKKFQEKYGGDEKIVKKQLVKDAELTILNESVVLDLDGSSTRW